MSPAILIPYHTLSINYSKKILGLSFDLVDLLMPLRYRRPEWFRSFALCAHILHLIDCTLRALSPGVTILTSNLWFDLLRLAPSELVLQRLRGSLRFLP